MHGAPTTEETPTDICRKLGTRRPRVEDTPTAKQLNTWALVLAGSRYNLFLRAKDQEKEKR